MPLGMSSEVIFMKSHCGGGFSLNRSLSVCWEGGLVFSFFSLCFLYPAVKEHRVISLKTIVWDCSVLPQLLYRRRS